MNTQVKLATISEAERDLFWSCVVPYFGLDESFDYDANPSLIRDYLQSYEAKGRPMRDVNSAFEAVMTKMTAYGILGKFGLGGEMQNLRMAISRLPESE